LGVIENVHFATIKTNLCRKRTFWRHVPPFVFLVVLQTGLDARKSTHSATLLFKCLHLPTYVPRSSFVIRTYICSTKLTKFLYCS
jgi:hypothetical protein